MKLIKVLIFISACHFFCSPAPSPDITDIKLQIKNIFQTYNGKHIIHVDKTAFRLSVYNREINIVANYKIAYGVNPDKKSKLYAGDNRTPEGIYKIVEILSIDADNRNIASKKLRAMNNVYFKASDGHYKFGNINADLGKNAYGPRFFRIDYPNEVDKRNYNDALAKDLIPKFNGELPPIGSGLAIHGTSDEPSIGHLASSGCIRMFNKDIFDLDKYVAIGTAIIITNN